MKIYEIIYERGDVFYVEAINEKNAFHILWEKNPDVQFFDLLSVKVVKAIPDNENVIN